MKRPQVIRKTNFPLKSIPDTFELFSKKYEDWYTSHGLGIDTMQLDYSKLNTDYDRPIHQEFRGTEQYDQEPEA